MDKKLNELVAPISAALVAFGAPFFAHFGIDTNLASVLITSAISVVFAALSFGITVLFKYLKNKKVYIIIESLIKQAETLVNTTGAEKKVWVLAYIEKHFKKINIKFAESIIDILVPAKKEKEITK